ncbi:hypothetical protein SteCoe_3240 [Stentor coeruleus]|uniref:Uncharacterized protein n=1 Tax=Stentor coeruleus TaxID=5963 RepID=A0A1R2AM99_9CILI|nr:hypothetical protein SteCoe_37850 [Stentor coeruleus]OMJ93678.1 hypothetical protein SteCoe_3240 [Stentor coeruleus]
MGCSESKVFVKKGLTDSVLFSSNLQSLIYNAISSDDLPKFQQIIDNGFNINYKLPLYNSRTALHIAAETNSISILLFLIKQGVNIEIEDELGLTPIFIAAMKNNKNCVYYLELAGANSNIVSNAYCNLEDISIEKRRKREEIRGRRRSVSVKIC